MSIRTNPMKAVPVLLKRVKTTRIILDQRGGDESLDGKLEKLTRELNKIDDVFMRVKKNQDELLDALHEVDGHLRKLDRKRLDKDMDQFCKRIRDCAHKLLPMDAFESDSSDEKSGEIVQSSSHDPSSSKHNNNELVLAQHMNLNLYQLRPQLRYCLVSLSIFPQDFVIKKRLAIYFWIGTRNIIKTEQKTAEEVGEDVFDELLKLNLIVPYGNAKFPIVNKFQIHPHIRHLLGSINWCLVLKQKNVMLGLDSQCCYVFNVSSSYLNFVSQWLDKKNSLLMLQLGCCQNSPSHHIEVGNEDFLKNLSNQRRLRYLSLRGISRVSKLPPSITKAESLQILDLKACHNLETLPDDISSMKSLTHLILSQCCLLDGMPKGIEKLTQLEVLKGFLIGSSIKTPCRISDLANLKKLRRLSIRIGSDAVIKDREFESLGELSSLKHLKISWAETRCSDIQIILPTSLKKLHLECFPGKKIPEWLRPSKLPSRLKLPHTSPESFKHSRLPKKFKELKITAGKLESMYHDEDMNKWSMEIVRLRYLRHLKVELTNLQALFPLLRYAEIRKISNHSYLEWSIEETGETMSMS